MHWCGLGTNVYFHGKTVSTRTEQCYVYLTIYLQFLQGCLSHSKYEGDTYWINECGVDGWMDNREVVEGICDKIHDLPIGFAGEGQESQCLVLLHGSLAQCKADVCFPPFGGQESPLPQNVYTLIPGICNLIPFYGKRDCRGDYACGLGIGKLSWVSWVDLI